MTTRSCRVDFVRRLAVFLTFGVAALGGCKDPAVPPPPSSGPAPAYHPPGGGTESKTSHDDTEPSLFGWDPDARATLTQLRQEGMVAVRYVKEGDTLSLHLLTHCVGRQRKYLYVAHAESQSVVAESEGEASAVVPLGIAKISGKLGAGRALRADYMIAGRLALPSDEIPSRAELRGADCKQATHVITAIHVGGFAVATGDRMKLEASGSLFTASAEGSYKSSGERVDRVGDPAACDRAREKGIEVQACDVPLRVSVLALEDTATKTAGPADVQSPPTEATRSGIRS